MTSIKKFNFRDHSTWLAFFVFNLALYQLPASSTLLRAQESGCDDFKARKTRALSNGPAFLAVFESGLENIFRLERQKKKNGLSPKQNDCLIESIRHIEELIRSATPELHAQVSFNNLLGRYYKSQGQLSFAKESFEKSIRRKTADFEANVELAMLAQREGDVELETLHLKRALIDKAADAGQKELQITAITRLMELVTSEEKLELSEKWLVLDASSSKALEHRADAALDLGKWDLLTKTLDRFPRSGGLYSYYRAHLLSVQKHYAEAAKEAEVFFKSSVAAKEPKRFQDFLRFTIQNWMKAGNYGRAQERARLGIQRFANDSSFRRLHEQALLENPKITVPALQAALEVNEHSAPLYRRLIEKLMSSQKNIGNKRALKQIEAYADKLMALDPSGLDSNYWKGMIAMHRQAFSVAEPFFAQVLTELRLGKKPLAPLAHSQIWLSLARAEAARGKSANAKALLEESLSHLVLQEDKLAVQNELRRFP